MKLKENGYRALVPLSGTVLAALLFLVGIGRYRTILVISCYYFIESLFIYAKINLNYIKPILGPFVIITIFLDVKYGQLLPIYQSNNVLIPLFVFILAELFFNKHLISFVEKLSSYHYFGCCPHCHFANKKLTTTCSNCGYAVNNSTMNVIDRTHSTSKSARWSSKCNTALNLHVPSKCISLINFEPNEESIGCVRIFPERGVYVNGSKVLLKYIIITTARIILLDYHFYYSGWTYRKYLGINSIQSLVITKKHHHNKQVPMLLLSVDDVTYEIFYSPFESAFEKLEAISSCIKNIKSESNLYHQGQ